MIIFIKIISSIIKNSQNWYEGSTNIPILDDTIMNLKKYGYVHHIPRLMVISNLMNLSGIAPQEVYKWFMECFIDSSDWVMTPNVFGMGLFSDGVSLQQNHIFVALITF